MPDLESLGTEQLFRRWRGGDTSAGQVMAQRFSDWYFAIAASRLGERSGNEPLDRACKRFGQGIVSVEDPSELTGWAHEILIEELSSAGTRSSGGDYPNRLTRGRSPTELLSEAATELPGEQVLLLAHTYDADYPAEELRREAERLGGYPLQLLEARYALKRWLRDSAGVAFTDVPDEPQLDRAPLPLYEAGRMAGNSAEESTFEKWMLTDIGICRDVAEFATFVLALRAGVLAHRAVPTAAPAARLPDGGDTTAPVEEPGTGGRRLLLGLAIVATVALVIGLVYALSHSLH